MLKLANGSRLASKNLAARRRCTSYTPTYLITSKWLVNMK